MIVFFGKFLNPEQEELRSSCYPKKIDHNHHHRVNYRNFQLLTNQQLHQLLGLSRLITLV